MMRIQFRAKALIQWYVLPESLLSLLIEISARVVNFLVGKEDRTISPIVTHNLYPRLPRVSQEGLHSPLVP